MAAPARAAATRPPVAIDANMHTAATATPIAILRSQPPRLNEVGSSSKGGYVQNSVPHKIPCSPKASNWYSMNMTVSPPPVGGFPPPVPLGTIKAILADAWIGERLVPNCCGVFKVTLGAVTSTWSLATIWIARVLSRDIHFISSNFICKVSPGIPPEKVILCGKRSILFPCSVVKARI